MKNGLEQKEAAERLDVSQPYLSLLESGKRNLTNKLAEKAVKVFALPLENLPFEADWEVLGERSNDELAKMLSALSYPKFSHLQKGEIRNPVEVLFSTLKKENLTVA